MIASMKSAANAAPPESTPAPAPTTTEQAAPAPTATATPEVASTQPATTPAATETAMVPAPDRTVATPTYYEDADAEGEFDETDSRKATMFVVAKTGKASNIFTPGDIVLNNEYVIGGLKQPIEVIAIGIKKCYQNDLPNEMKKTGDVVAKAADVINKGGVVQYRPNDDKTSTHYWKPILQIVFLVKKPADISPAAAALFMYEIEGQSYALVRYTARSKTAYNGVAIPLIETKKLKGTVRGTVFKFSNKGEDWEAGNRSWIQSNVSRVGDTDPKVIEFLKEYCG